MRYSPPRLIAVGSLMLATAGCGAPAEQPAPAPPSVTTAATVSTPAPVTTEGTRSAPSLPPDTVALTTTTASETVGPTVAQPPLVSCIDATSQIAPTLIPKGWQRFVLQAQPTGTCDQHPFLTMSLVSPATATSLGKLVTITIGGAGGVPIDASTPVVINGSTGYLSTATMADGTPSAIISIDVGGVPVEAHGTVGKDQLVAIIASIRPLDDAEWADLVNSVVHAP